MNSNFKEWSKPIVAEKHEYLNLENISSQIPFHIEIANIISNVCNNKSHIKIIDFGCGNGRLYNALISNLNKLTIEYVGTDINLSVLTFAKEHFMQNSNVSFFYCDFDIIPITLQETKMNNDKSVLLSEKNIDICVFDSTINMAEFPDLVLKHICSYVPLVIMTRVKFGDKVEKNSYVWNGMTSPSTNWQFTHEYFYALAESSNKICDISGNTVVFRNI